MKRLFLIIAILFFKLLTFAQQEENSFFIADSLNNAGDKIFENGNFHEALEKYFLAYNSIQKTDSVQKETEILNNIGVMYDYLGEYADALKHYLLALEICDREGLLKQKAISYNNIGALYFFREKYKEALSYYELSLSIEFEIGDTLGIAQSYENIGIIHKRFEDYVKAEDYYLDALEIYKNIEYSGGISNVFANLGSLNYEQQKYKKALNFYLKSYEIQKNNNDLTGQVFSLNSIADIYTVQKEYLKAETLFLKSLEISKKSGLNEQVRYSYNALSVLYEKTKQDEKALVFYKLYTQNKDSVFNISKHKQFEELQTKYETEKKENRIVQQELVIKKNNVVILASVIGLSIGLVFILIMSWLYIQKHKAYKLLVKLNIELANQSGIVTKSEKRIQAEKYSKSSLTENVKSELHEKIIAYLENEKPYLNKHFSIDDIAEALDTNKKYISRIINQDFGTNFNNFINKFRVNHARIMILDPENQKLSLQGIAELSGFNTRATFISAFKKFAGVTPSYFMKKK